MNVFSIVLFWVENHCLSRYRQVEVKHFERSSKNISLQIAVEVGSDHIIKDFVLPVWFEGDFRVLPELNGCLPGKLKSHSFGAVPCELLEKVLREVPEVESEEESP